MLKAIFYTLHDEVPEIFEYEVGAIMSYLAISSQCHFGNLAKILVIKKGRFIQSSLYKSNFYITIGVVLPVILPNY
jgi:hypothetical protein